MESIERAGRFALTTGDPEGPEIQWGSAIGKHPRVPTLGASGRCAVDPDTGRIYFQAITVTRMDAPVGSDEIRGVPITSMLTRANGYFRDGILRQLVKLGDPTAAALVEDEPDVVAGHLAGLLGSAEWTGSP